MTKWWFVLADLECNPITEIRNATSRSLTLAMGKPSTASFVIRADNAIMPYLFEASDKVLLVWSEGPVTGGQKVLRFAGQIVTSELSSGGETPTIQVNAIDPAWILSKRIPYTARGKTGTTYTEKDKGEIALAILEAAELDDQTRIALSGAGFEYKSGTKGTYTVGPWRYALSMINDLANSIDGFDWFMIPWASGGDIAQWHAAATIGSQRENSVFEFGTGRKNVKSITYLRDLGNLANVVYHVPDDIETETVVEKFDKPSIESHGLHQTIADASGLRDFTLRSKWAEDNIIVRKQPRRVMTMTLRSEDGTGRVPFMASHQQYLAGDYFLGDFVRVRGAYNDVELFDGYVRIYQLEITINEAGRATVTPIMIDDNGEL